MLARAWQSLVEFFWEHEGECRFEREEAFPITLPWLSLLRNLHSFAFYCLSHFIKYLIHFLSLPHFSDSLCLLSSQSNLFCCNFRILFLHLLSIIYFLGTYACVLPTSALCLPFIWPKVTPPCATSSRPTETPRESKLRAPCPLNAFLTPIIITYLSLSPFLVSRSCWTILTIDQYFSKINTNSYSSFMYFNLVNDIICLKLIPKLSELLLVYSVTSKRRRIERSFNLIYISSGKAMPSRH